MGNGLTSGEGVDQFHDVDGPQGPQKSCQRCGNLFDGPAATCSKCRRQSIMVGGAERTCTNCKAEFRGFGDLCKECLDGPVNQPKQVSALHRGGYVGPYNRLMDFINYCRRHQYIGDEDNDTLMTAVKDLKYGETTATGVGVDESLDEDAADLLKTLGVQQKEQQVEKTQEITGISCLCGQTIFRDGVTFCMNCGAQEAMMMMRHETGSGPSQIIFPKEVMESTDFLTDYEANVVVQGKDIKRDVGTLMTCFQQPFDLQMRHHIKKSSLSRWMESIADQYLKVPYHSWRHAYDVLQWSYMHITVGRAGMYFHFRDILSLYIAELAHDVAHPGLTNNYLIANDHDLALRYNDMSPLENMHAHVCFLTMRRPGHNVLENMSAEAATHIRSRVIDAILATDMKDHYSLVELLGPASEQEDDRQEEKEDRRLLIKGFTHMADLAQCCRPWRYHKYLTAGLEQEQFFQGDLEREMGRPITPLMDRDRDSLATVQKFFMEVMIQPLLLPFEKLIDAEHFELALGGLMDNAATWKRYVDQNGPLTCNQIVALQDDEALQDEEDARENEKT